MLTAALVFPVIACAACARPTSPGASLLIGSMMVAPLVVLGTCAWLIRVAGRG